MSLGSIPARLRAAAHAAVGAVAVLGGRGNVISVARQAVADDFAIDPDQVAALRSELGLDQPLATQYVRYLGDLVRGDMGRSLYTGRPVAAIIGEQFSSSVELALAAFVVSAILGLALGIAAGWYPRRLPGRAANSLSALATGLPVAVLGLLAIQAASALTRPLPFILVWTRSGGLTLPALTLGFAASGPLARAIQAGLLETSAAPYLVAARAHGVGEGARLLWHALRPVLPLAVALASLQAAFLLSGTVVTETVFSRPGLGRLLVSSILEGDFPVVQGLVVVAAAVYALTHATADGVALILDPRLRESS